MAVSGKGGPSLETTPTWIVALVCTVIVSISLALERVLFYIGKYLKKKNQKPLFQALQKVKEELMLLGFISLLLTVSQGRLVKICVDESVTRHFLPCELARNPATENKGIHPHRQLAAANSLHRYCHNKGKVPLLSMEAIHHLHILIFVLAIVHVTISVLTVVVGGLRIRQWKSWEDAIVKSFDIQGVEESPRITHIQEHKFIQNRFMGLGKTSPFMSWVHAFFKQFYGSVTKSDYTALRHGFIMMHCRGNPKFNFHRYMIRALEDDFRKVVGVSWYLWVFVIVFLLLNLKGWHTYFWMVFVPFIILLIVGTKLEHVFNQLAHEVAEKHSAIEGDLIVRPSNDHFWFHHPRLILLLLHFVLFQNAFEIAFFFFVWVQYGFASCIMESISFIIPRLVIGATIQILASYSTLPLYAIVTQMGSSFKRSIFEEHIQLSLIGWAQKVKRKSQLRSASTAGESEPNTPGGIR